MATDVTLLVAAVCAVLAVCQAANRSSSGLTITETDGITIASFTNPVKTPDSYDYAYYGDVAESEPGGQKLVDAEPSQTANYTNGNGNASASVDQPRQSQQSDEYYADYEHYNLSLDVSPSANKPSSEKQSPIDSTHSLENEAYNKSLTASSTNRKTDANANANANADADADADAEVDVDNVELSPEPELEPKPDLKPDSEAKITQAAEKADADTDTDVDYGEWMEPPPPGFSETATLPPESVAESDAHCRYEVEESAKGKQQKAGNKRQKPLNPPCFDSASATVNMTVEHGSNAVLVCQVRMLGKSSVTWWREGEAFPTAVGHNIFVRNDRLAVNPGKRDWNMIIRFVQPQDAGVYKCQINTQPLKNLLIRLNVVDELPFSPADGGYQINDSSSDARTGDKRKPKKARSGPAKVEIRGKDVVVTLGREAELTCYASGKKGVAPESVDWFFRGHKVKTSQRIMVMNSVKNHQLISVIRINPVTISDAGTYICRSSERTTSTYHLAVICVDGSNCGNLQAFEADSIRIAPVVAPSGHGSACMPAGLLLLSMLLCSSLPLLKSE